MNTVVPTLRASQLPEDITRHHAIPPMSLVIRPRFGPLEHVETERSNVLFAALRRIAQEDGEVIRFACSGADLDPASLAALNSFLRAQRAMGRMRHPWDRIPDNTSADTRHDWAALVRHLALRFPSHEENP